MTFVERLKIRLLLLIVLGLALILAGSVLGYQVGVINNGTRFANLVASQGLLIQTLNEKWLSCEKEQWINEKAESLIVEGVEQDDDVD